MIIKRGRENALFRFKVLHDFLTGVNFSGCKIGDRVEGVQTESLFRCILQIFDF